MREFNVQQHIHAMSATEAKAALAAMVAAIWDQPTEDCGVFEIGRDDAINGYKVMSQMIETAQFYGIAPKNIQNLSVSHSVYDQPFHCEEI